MSLLKSMYCGPCLLQVALQSLSLFGEICSLFSLYAKAFVTVLIKLVDHIFLDKPKVISLILHLLSNKHQ